jgi:serine/threonine protein kinase
MIGGDKIGEGSYGCIYHPAINKDGSEIDNKKYVSKIQKNNKYANNEKIIGELITKIDGYINHFAPIIKKELLKTTKIKKDFFKQCSALKDSGKNDSLIIMKMEYINGDDFIEYLIKNKGSIDIVKNLISSYTHLLTSIKLLTDAKIIHYDLKGDNILFNKDKEIPIMIDFGLSINMNELINQSISIEKLKKYFYVYGADYYVWPIEVHYLCYILHVNENPSSEDINKICDEFVKENVALTLNFSNSFIKSYKKKCVKILEGLNTHDFSSRVNKVLSYWYTWDNYALSIIYLLFVYYLNINGYLKNDLIIYFSEMLLTNINPDSSERLNVVETKSKFTEFLYNLNMSNVVNLNEVKEMFVYNRGNIEIALKEQKKLLQKKSKSIRY